VILDSPVWSLSAVDSVAAPPVFHPGPGDIARPGSFEDKLTSCIFASFSWGRRLGLRSLP
jgi:hypothetical protein